jgi:Flp pilus assembly protein TadD
MMKRPLFVIAAALALAATACKPKAKEITSLQRKEAAMLVSEAEFAARQLRDYARAEGLLTKATALCPDNAKYWVDLGALRVRLGNKDAARAAYKSALSAYEGLAIDGNDPQPLLQQVYVLALLGQADNARAVLAKAQKKFPDNRAVRGFTEGGQFDKMLADPRFKEIAL